MAGKRANETTRLQDHETTRPRDDKTARRRDYGTTGPRDHGTTRPRDCETTGRRDHETTRPRDDETTRRRDHETTRLHVCEKCGHCPQYPEVPKSRSPLKNTAIPSHSQAFPVFLSLSQSFPVFLSLSQPSPAARGNLEHSAADSPLSQKIKNFFVYLYVIYSYMKR